MTDKHIDRLITPCEGVGSHARETIRWSFRLACATPDAARQQREAVGFVGSQPIPVDVAHQSIVRSDTAHRPLVLQVVDR
jgi:hypothetical protein